MTSEGNSTISALLPGNVDRPPPLHVNYFNVVVVQYNKSLNDLSFEKPVNFVSLESQCFPRLLLGKHQSRFEGKKKLFPSGPVNKCLLATSTAGNTELLINPPWNFPVLPHISHCKLLSLSHFHGPTRCLHSSLTSRGN